MLMGLCVLIALAVVALTGGDLRRLADLRLRSQGLLYLALAVQVLITDFLTTWPHPVLVAAHLVTYAAAALIVWRNRPLPGLPLLAFGAACNGLTIAANGGTLPASAAALRRAGIRIDPGLQQLRRARAPAVGLARGRLRRPGRLAAVQCLQRR